MKKPERLAVDTNAAIDFLRPDRVNPAPLLSGARILLPLPLLGELFAGANFSDRVAENLVKVEEVLAAWEVFHPDVETARIYGRLRKVNDSLRRE